jgi:anti-anti-sigma factor
MSYASRWNGRLSIRHDAVMGVQVLTLDGELDDQTAETAQSSVDVAVKRGSPLVIDLRCLKSMDGAGAALLRLAATRAENAGIRFAAVRPETLQITRALEDARLDRELPFEDSVSQAIATVAPKWHPEGDRWTPTASTPIDPHEGK